MNSVETEVLDTIAAIKKIQQPSAHAILKDDLGIDSIALVKIITRLTQKLKVNIFEFSDQDLANVKVVGDLVDLFTSKAQR